MSTAPLVELIAITAASARDHPVDQLPAAERQPFAGIGGLPTESGGIRVRRSGRFQATDPYPTDGAEAAEVAEKPSIDCTAAPQRTELITKENAERACSRPNRC